MEDKKWWIETWVRIGHELLAIADGVEGGTRYGPFNSEEEARRFADSVTGFHLTYSIWSE